TPLLPGAVVTLALDDPSGPDAAGSPSIAGAVRAATAADGRIALRVANSQVAVTARVPDTGALPGGQPVAILQIEQRATVLAEHVGASGVAYADVVPLRDPRPTPRLEGLTRELRTVLEEIARLRRSRRLPELLESVTDPG